MSLLERKMAITFTLGEGAFGESGHPDDNTVTLSGQRMIAKIVKAGGNSMGTASLDIFGMTPSVMNRLSTLGMAITLVRRNTVAVLAGDDDVGLGLVFEGTITDAWVDTQSAPEVSFHVEAHTGLIEAVKPVPAVSYTGSTDVATIMSSIATQMGRTFENNGVNVKLQSPYYWGSARSQAQDVANHANIEWVLDNNKLAIWPKGGFRGGAAPLISPQTGMINSPAFTSKGISVATLFNPSIGFGSKIVVDSFLVPARGEWIVYSLDHDLSANAPGGPWFTRIGAARPGTVVVH